LKQPEQAVGLARLGAAGTKALSRVLAALGAHTVVGPSGLSGAIVPSLDISDSLCQYETIVNGNEDPLATGNFTVWTVPPGELWKLYWMRMTEDTATCTFDAFWFDVGLQMNTNVQAAGTEIEFWWPTPLMLPAGSELGVRVAAYSTGKLDGFAFVGRCAQLTPPALEL